MSEAAPTPPKLAPYPMEVRWGSRWKNVNTKEMNGVITEVSRMVPVLLQWRPEQNTWVEVMIDESI